MSDNEEEETFCYFGKPLEPYDEDAFPKKKPIAVEDQVATDAQGRRRFHGAFTGGFSAGFYNTVGSLEGWTPSEFKSTRESKAANRTQRPEDFMDEEDTGQFGIAPQTVKAGKDFDTSNKKRKRQVFSDGPIPGEPVLHTLLTSGNETVGYMLLKNIGLKEKSKSKPVDNEPEPGSDRVYGCQMPKSYEISRHEDYEQYPMADIYREYLKNPKSNTFGLGYSGLDKSHLNLFTPAKLVVNEKNKKKLSISGQAFGVGAFEDDDEDIYVKEDMTRYDFELTSEKIKKKQKSKEEVIYDIFVRAKNILPFNEVYAPPTIPHSFTGKHKKKKSRFEPLPTETEPPLSGIKRKDVDAEVRARALGEEPPPPPPPSVKAKEVPKVPELKNTKGEDDSSRQKSGVVSDWSKNLVLDKFVSAGQQDQSNILEEVVPSHTEHGTEEMRGAVRMKMFGPLTRISSDWHPCSVLCRRFNVPEPSLELSKGAKKQRTKNLIFEYQKHSEVPWDLKPGLSKTTETEETTIKENPPEASMEGIIETDVSATTSTKDTTPEAKEGVQPPLPISLDITERIDLSKNTDLFKAVFLSSDESEESDNEVDKNEENTETLANSKEELMKAQVLSEVLLPKIQPIREGILSNVNPQMLGMQPLKGNEEKIVFNANRQKELDPNLYGPLFLPAPATTANENKNKKTSSISVVSSSSEEDWVEKDHVGNNEEKSHKKKEKKKKSHHKKHKKKHKHKKK